MKKRECGYELDFNLEKCVLEDTVLTPVVVLNLCLYKGKKKRSLGFHSISSISSSCSSGSLSSADAS